MESPILEDLFKYSIIWIFYIKKFVQKIKKLKNFFI